MSDPTLPLDGLSSVNGKAVVARFDGGSLSSDSGVIALAEVEKRLGIARRLARCIEDPRRPDQIVHGLTDMIGFRMKMIAAGYENGNDATRLPWGLPALMEPFQSSRTRAMRSINPHGSPGPSTGAASASSKPLEN